MRDPKALLALAYPPTQCFLSPLQVRGAGVVRACGPSVEDRCYEDEMLAHGVLDAVKAGTHGDTIWPPATPLLAAPTRVMNRRRPVEGQLQGYEKPMTDGAGDPAPSDLSMAVAQGRLPMSAAEQLLLK